MSDITKMNSNKINLEEDFGSEELNKIYKNLDEKTQKEINSLSKLDFKIAILQNLSDPEFTSFYEKMKDSEKKQLESFKIRDRFLFIKRLMKKSKVDEPSQPKPVQVEIVSDVKEPPSELLNDDDDDDKIESTEYNEDNTNIKPIIKLTESTIAQKEFNNLIKLFYNSSPYTISNKNHELEVRFGTRGIKPLNKHDYDNVIKKLKSLGFTSLNEVGMSSLKIQSEYLDKNTGRFKLSNVRVSINDLNEIQKYCKTNSIKDIYNKKSHTISFINKIPVFINNEKIMPVNFDDFNFRVSYQIEEEVSVSSKNFIIQNWTKNKKTFRYMNRVTFNHVDYPINVDISITKFNSDNYKRTYTIEESNVFQSPEKIEIELEVDNTKIGPYTKFDSPEKVLEAIRKVIKFVLGGLQNTNFPISYSEQRNTIMDYMKLLHKDEPKFNLEKRIYPSDFIGPSSFTLQMSNIAEIDDNTNIPNIRNDFVVTDKADGERHLMFINSNGKIYLINTNMNVIFTGVKTNNKDLFNTLLDGELIYHDKFGKFINLYAGFDIYYLNNVDTRILPFMIKEDETTMKSMDQNKIYNSRYMLLKSTINMLKPVSILDNNINTKESTNINVETLKKLILPIRITFKKFYPESKQQGNIFEACKNILTKIRESRFEYLTDGLIFTHAYFGVGSNKEGQTGPLTKITWDYSFKWKPPKDNTIDFFVVTVKQPGGEDMVKTKYEEGFNSHLTNQLSEYKMIQLCCTYSEKKHGTIYLNPCQDIIDDKLPEYKEVNYEDRQFNDAKPLQFYPSEPFDPEAGICNIMLKVDDNNVRQMFTEENEIFDDNMIVEFSYDLTKEKGWRWCPKRVRYDKTSEFLQGLKNFGNAYHVANSNWKSINNPITEDMISSGQNIPDITVDEDIYYNKPAGKTLTESMKNFHNLYVKKLLIKSVSKYGDTLIDYACGKAGDLPKWISCRLSFVFGIDKSKNNLEDRIDGACVRYLNSKKTNKHIPYALFVNGDTSYNIKNGSAMLNDKAVQITKAIFGIGPKDEDKLGKGVYRQYSKGEDGFNISSCQFAVHYFLENPETLQGFMRNIAECTKLDGYFIGTCYDGKQVFNLLKKTQQGESIQIVEKGKKVWEVVKGYTSESFEDNSSSIGYRIDVYQDSINQLISEYLVNFDYFDQVLNNYGFKIVDSEEAKSLGLPEGSGLFSELYMNMIEEIKKNKNKEKDYGNALNMSEYEKKISFLNRYFVYKKIRNVNTEKIQMEFSDYSPSEILNDEKETKQAVEIAKVENKIIKSKVRKLNKKLIIESS
jgi:hypothetical protein